MNKRRQQKAATRQLILTTAKDCYCQQGFQVATKEIATKARISHGSIFAHFPKAEALHLAVISDYLDSFGQDLAMTFSEKVDLSTYLTKWLALIEADSLFYRRLISESAFLSERCQSRLIAFQTTAAVDLEMLLTKEPKVKQLPLPFLINTWLGTVNYYYQHQEWFAPSDSKISDTQELVANFLMLIRK